VDQFTDLRLAAVKSAEIEQLQQWITNRAIDLRNRVGSGELTTEAEIAAAFAEGV